MCSNSVTSEHGNYYSGVTMRPLVAALASLGLASAYIYEEDLLYDHFPEDFVWGAATAAYQVGDSRNFSASSILTLILQILQAPSPC